MIVKDTIQIVEIKVSANIYIYIYGQIVWDLIPIYHLNIKANMNC